MRRALPAFVLYCSLTLALAHPLVLQLGSAFPHDPGDPALNTWILWWNAQTIPLTAAWWNAPAFYPVPGVLSFSETLLGLTVMSTPMQWLGSSPLAAYNAIFLLTFPLCGIAAYLLALEITKRRDAAFIAGVLFVFAPYRMSHLPHLQVLAAFGMPAALFALHRYLRDPRASWLMLFGAAWVWQGLANGYYLLFFSVLLGMWMLWFVPPTTAPKPFRAILTAGVLAVLPLLPILWQYRTIHESMGFVRDFGTVRHYGADALALLSTEPKLWLWGWLQVYRGAEGQIFPGLTIVLLIAAAVWAGWPHRSQEALPDHAALRIVRRVLWGVAILTGLTALAVSTTDPWEIRLFGIQVLSIGNPVKPLTWALASLMILAITSAPVRRAWSERSILGFYAVAAAVMWVLCLGPAPTWMGAPLMYRGPYVLLMALPGFSSLRVPARFWMLSVLCLSVIGAILFDRLAARFPAARRVLLAVVVVAAVAEGWMMTFPVAPVPDVWKPDACAPPRGSDGAVLELPMGGVIEDVGAMYRSISHRRPTINGYSGYFPPHYAALHIGLGVRDPDMLARLAQHGARYVMIDRGYAFEHALRQYVGGQEGAELVCSNDTHVVYRLPSRTVEQHLGAPLAVAALSANAGGNLVALMTDGDLTTRWVAGPQDPGIMVEIDMGELRRIGAIEMSLGAHDRDFPRGLKIEASEDGREWREVWSGRSAGLAFTAALRRPVAIPLVFGLSSVEARFLRMSLTEKDDTFYWSIAEMRVLGP